MYLHSATSQIASNENCKRYRRIVILKTDQVCSTAWAKLVPWEGLNR